MLRKSEIIKSRPLRFIVTGCFNSAFGLLVFGAVENHGAATWLALLFGNVAGVLSDFIFA
jgi:putative flippase GtrA